MPCVRAAYTPQPALRKGGKSATLVFPPLRRGDTGGFFECLRVASGPSRRRLKIALLPSARKQRFAGQAFQPDSVPCQTEKLDLLRCRRKISPPESISGDDRSREDDGEGACSGQNQCRWPWLDPTLPGAKKWGRSPPVKDV